MEALTQKLEQAAIKLLKEKYGFETDKIDFQETRKEFEGDVTLVVFPYMRFSKKSPEETGTDLGEALVAAVAELESYNVVKGFLNLKISASFWANCLTEISQQANYGHVQPNPADDAMMVEYSSPNTNKPLHLGHIRNNLLGYSVANIIEAAGTKVIKVQIINDRGIHICKSMLAWKKFSNGETPETSGLKGDKLVGKYYVEFDKAYKAEIDTLVNNGMNPDEAAKKAPLILEAQDMLRKWELGDPETVKLWETMNGWVYEGFEATYKKLGVDFDRNYYESNTYLLGKKDVEKGLEAGVFFKKEDGSVWIDLSDEGLDQKLVLRADGTSVYMTQDIGTAIQRFEDFRINGCVYVVGNEQDYHFKVLFLILKKLGYEWAEHLHHLSYGMVDLPTGKMKSREGTVVDADDLIDEMQATATKISEELGKVEGMDEAEKKELNRIIGLGALKYFILKVDPQKRMMFNPEESIDFNGNTGPFIQYTHARIQSLLRKAGPAIEQSSEGYVPNLSEQQIIRQLAKYPGIVQRAATEYSPALVANFVFDLVKMFNGFYQQYSILKTETPEMAAFRLKLSREVGRTIKSGMGLLGIECPERM